MNNPTLNVRSNVAQSQKRSDGKRTDAAKQRTLTRKQQRKVKAERRNLKDTSR